MNAIKDHLSVGRSTLSLMQGGQEKQVEVFTLTLGGETMDLLPLKNWGQLDVHKWGVQGKLPGTPAGLEVTIDHVKIAGETVSVADPEGCAKLEKVFNEWLDLEKATMAASRQKAQAKPVVKVQAAASPEAKAPRFRVDVEGGGQVHVKILQGKETLASIGLNAPGFHSLCHQGLMKKPKGLKVGALHDWVEIDGVLYSFEKGNNDASKLEQALNEHYLPSVTLGHGKDVIVLENSASATGFDLQFPVMMAGTADSRKRHMNDGTLEILQDAERCGLLHKDVVIKLSPPNLIFKRKTSDGGEKYFDKGPGSLVSTSKDDGTENLIDLSRPVNYLNLTPMELTAVFNHPSIHKHGKEAAPVGGAAQKREVAVPAGGLAEVLAVVELPKPPVPEPLPPVPVPPTAPLPTLAVQDVVAAPASEAAHEAELAALNKESPPAAEPEAKPSPNAWLKDILAVPCIRHEWFACLVYGKMAQWLGSSCEGTLGLSHCWAISLGDVEDPGASDFEGIFFTEKGGFGYTCRERMARFNKGVVFLGTLESGIEGIGVTLAGAGIDVEKRMVFIVSDNYRTKFGVPEPTVARELALLRDCGVLVMSVSETLASSEELEVVWTVPAEQSDPENPQVEEHKRPE